ncbi:BMP family ABC transporter substrate-binding protein [Halalkaliarchaeum sp. AArc-GB]|uniref:BMP family lipoprotein n=1 Tax=Halalkaliarchaeum sp. AArc-GB TaxID=3074078 RepID=UPI00285D751C|nr:BMP family ABC transporter substrate-binding protein [Halalkaliarchaeum sp. AArc-GB]MDR5674178.1 BMP family ABC transporter substrate-binding protein [Halalkaliarchaeum sp. AArc-GB]
MNRRQVLAAGGGVLGTTLIAGCLGEEGEGDEFAIVSSPAGFDDQAFNDNAREGLERAAEEHGYEVNAVEETEEAEYQSVQAELAEQGRYGVIVLVGFNHLDALETNAPEYSEQNWMLINDHIEGQDNVSGWIEMNNEMSFLAGVAAGVLTTEDITHDGSSTDPDGTTVGFVGGEDIDLINAFEQSYIEGVEWVNDDVEVLTGYGGSFSDTSAAQDVAESQIDDGADIVWHAASAAGRGVFAAAQNADRFALGVDVDQSVTAEQYSDVILGSAVKALDEATYQVGSAVAEDDWDSVSGEQNLSIEQGGIDFVVGQDFEGGLPDALDEALDDARQAFIDGEIELTCGPTGC